MKRKRKKIVSRPLFCSWCLLLLVALISLLRHKETIQVVVAAQFSNYRVWQIARILLEMKTSRIILLR